MIGEKPLLNQLVVLSLHQNNESDTPYKELFSKVFKEYYSTNSIEEAMKLYNDKRIDIFITDINQESMGLIKYIKDRNINQPIIIFTENDDKEYLIKAFELNVSNYILKPIEISDLTKKIELVAKRWLLKKHNTQKRKILQQILDNQSGLTLLTDFKTISFASKSFLDFYNFKVLSDFFYVFDNILDMFAPNENYLNSNNKEEFLKQYKEAKAINKVVLLVGKAAQPKAFHIHIDKIENSDTDMYLLSLTNISILQEQNIEITHKAFIDGLTGIYNRNKFEDLYEYELSKYKRYDTPFCIALLDIDHFKKFNDTYGHLIGDEVLVALAQSVNDNVRDSDTFSRWGGEEFILLMPETKLDDAKIVCNNLRLLIEALEHPSAGNITSSFGVTQVCSTDDLNSIFKRCDEALYNAKANGRNRVEALEV